LTSIVKISPAGNDLNNKPGGVDEVLLKASTYKLEGEMSVELQVKLLRVSQEKILKGSARKTE